MVFRFLSLTLVFVGLFAAAANAQQRRSEPTTSKLPDASERPERSYNSGDPMLENLTKLRIRAQVKEHQEFVQRGVEVAKLTAELNESVQNSGGLNSQKDFEALNQVEKNVKKIRKVLGGSDDDDAGEIKAATLAEAATRLAEIGAVLSEEIKKSSRYTVSADSIDGANEMLELISFIRRSAKR